MALPARMKKKERAGAERQAFYTASMALFDNTLSPPTLSLRQRRDRHVSFRLLLLHSPSASSASSNSEIANATHPPLPSCRFPHPRHRSITFPLLRPQRRGLLRPRSTATIRAPPSAMPCPPPSPPPIHTTLPREVRQQRKERRLLKRVVRRRRPCGHIRQQTHGELWCESSPGGLQRQQQHRRCLSSCDRIEGGAPHRQRNHRPTLSTAMRCLLLLLLLRTATASNKGSTHTHTRMHMQMRLPMHTSARQSMLLLASAGSSRPSHPAAAAAVGPRHS